MIKDIGDCIRMNDQLILKFPSHRAYKKEDFYVSPSNQEAYDFINSWPAWIKRIANIFGPSGSGKTTLLNVLSGLDSLTSGEIIFNENDIHNLNEKEKSIYHRN